MKIIDLSAGDPGFLAEVESRSGQQLKTCYQCGNCTAGCPYTFAYDIPVSQIMRLIQAGQRETVLNSKSLWLCASCQSCTTRCPNQIDVAKVMDVCRHMARESGCVSERTSKLSGVNVKKVKRRVYALMGVLVAVTSVIQIARIGSMDYANAGSGYEMDAIAAVIIGGTSMSGGRGSVIGSVLGMLILAVMNNLLNLLGVPPFLREAFKGVIVIAAVLLQKKDSGN